MREPREIAGCARQADADEADLAVPSRRAAATVIISSRV